MVIFISGHLDLTEEDFNIYYRREIIAGCRLHADFVVGDAPGVDTMAQELLHIFSEEQVTVYHMFDTPRNNPYGFKTIGGFTTDLQRDEAMTLASTDDIAYVSWEKRSKKLGDRISGTEANLRRRGKTLPWHMPVLNIKDYSTRALLDMRYSSWSGNARFTEDELYTELALRPHIFNKKDSKKLRQEAAKRKV